MRPHRTRPWAAAAAVVAVCALGIFGTSQASYAAAATAQVCAQNGTGLCMNNWNGDGDVRMYTNNNTHNNDFAIQVISGCSGPGGVSCVQIAYIPSNLTQCLASNGGDYTGEGGLGTCGKANQGGNGADLGVIQWMTSPSWCHGGVGLENRYWTQRNGSPSYVQSGGAVGVEVNMEGDDETGTSCWGQVP
jgi:hypothetical protein